MSVNATTYNKILSKGIEANLPAIEDGKLRFTTDTGRLFLDNGTSRIEITDFIKGKTETEIKSTLAPLPKIYLSSDSRKLFYYDDGWKEVRASEAVNASTAEYAKTANNSNTASSASTATISMDAIKSITRSGTSFTVTRNDNSTFSFNQQDNNTTYTANNGVGISGNTFYNSGVRSISLNGNNVNVNINGSTSDITIPYATNASTADYSKNAATATVATKDSSGNTITSTYAPLASPVFTGTPTTPNISAGDSSTKIANTKFVSDAITSAISGIAQFDFEVVTTLPTTGVKGKIYLVASGSTTTQNIYDEYIWIGDKYEKLGTTQMDLSNYVNTVTESGTGNAYTGFTKNGSTLTLNKNSTFLTSHPAINHNSSTASAAPAAGTTFSVISDLITDNYGHGTSFTKTYVTMPNSVSNASTANYSKNAISSITRSGLTFTATRFDGSTFTFTQKDDNTTYGNFTSAAAGLAPASGGGTTKYLRADGSWQVPPDNNTTYDVASVGSAGLMPGLNAESAQFLAGDGTWRTPIGTTYGVATIGSAGLMPGLNGDSAQFLTGTGTWETPIGTTYDIASVGSVGLMPGLNGEPSQFLTGTGTWATPTNTTYANMTSAAAGLAPASGGGTTKYLRADGTWQEPPNDNTTYANMTSAAAGLAPAGGSGTTKYLRQDGSWQVPPDNNTTYGVFSGAYNGLVPKAVGAEKFLRADATWATPTNTTYANMTSAAAGLAPAGGSGTTKYLRQDGSWQVPPNTTYGVFSGAYNGLVPKAVGTEKFLRADATWATPTNTTYANATTASNGLLPILPNDVYKFLRGDGIWEEIHTVSTSRPGLAPTLPSGTSQSKLFLRGDGYWMEPIGTTYNVFTSSASGLAPQSDGSSIKFLRADGYWMVPNNTTYAANTWATSAANGTSGLFNTIPPKDGYNTKFLRADGTWVVPTNTTYANMTSAAAGLAPAGGSGTTKYLRQDGSWQVPPDTKYTAASGGGLSLSGTAFSINTSASTVAYATVAGKATSDGSGNTITSTYAPKASPAFTGSPTTPDVAAGDSSSKIANTKFVGNAISTAIAGVTQFDFEVVTTLPTTGVKGKIYLVTNGTSTTQNIYDEYIWIGDKYEKLGTTQMDLTNYVNTVTTSGSGNAVTGFSKSGNTLTLTKGKTFLESVPSYYATTATYTAGTGISKSGTAFSINTGAALNLNASTVAYAGSAGSATNASTADYGKNAIDTITRSGNTFTVTRFDGSTFTFSQKDSNTTYANMTSAAAGLAPAGGSGTTKYLRQDGTWQVPPNDNTTYGNMTSAAAGLAPAGGSGTTKYLRQDGSWQVPPNTTYGNMTSAAAGLAPASGGGTTKYLRADGSWQVPPDTNTTYAISGSGESVKLTGSNGGTSSVSLTTLINGLSEGTSAAQRDDYYVSQYAGGGTSTTSYHRRKVSSLFAALNKSDVTTALGYTPPTTNTTYANMTSAAAGLAPAGGSGTTKYLRQDGSWQVPPNTTYGNMTSAAAGLAPAGGSGTTKYLRQDGSWQVPPDNNTTYGNMTSAAAGLAPAGGSGTTKYLRQDGSWQVPPNTTYGNMTSAAAGLAPAGGSGTTKYLRQDGTWQVPPNTTYAANTWATSAANGTSGIFNTIPPKDGYNTKFLRADGTWVVPTDTKYTAASGGGLSLSGTAFSINTSASTVAYATKAGSATSATNASTSAYASSVSWGNVGGKPDTYPPTIGTGSTQAAAGNHTHSAYVNQNAFSNVIVGSTTIAADTTTDTLTLDFNSGISARADTTNDKISIGAVIFSSASAGIVPASGGGTTKYLRADGSWQVPPDNNTTYGNMTSAAAGLAPAGGSGTTKYLRQDGTWQVPPNDNTTYGAMSVAEGTAGTATTSRAMTAANLKGILQGSTYIHSYAPCVEADFDFGELTANGETYTN